MHHGLSQRIGEREIAPLADQAGTGPGLVRRLTSQPVFVLLLFTVHLSFQLGHYQIGVEVGLQKSDIGVGLEQALDLSLSVIEGRLGWAGQTLLDVLPHLGVEVNLEGGRGA